MLQKEIKVFFGLLCSFQFVMIFELNKIMKLLKPLNTCFFITPINGFFINSNVIIIKRSTQGIAIRFY
jgi:hypothetical protein